VAKKKVKKLPKLQRSAKPKPVNVKGDALKKARARAKQTGRVEDVAAAIEQLM